jgi:hypothetical protein
MKRFYLIYYQEDKKVQQAVALLPWGHNLILMKYNLSPKEIIFYSNEVYPKIKSAKFNLNACRYRF